MAKDDFGTLGSDIDAAPLVGAVNISHGALQRMHSALVILGNRFMPSTPADIRVANLLKAVSDQHETIEAARTKIARRIIDEVGGPIAVDNLKSAAQQAVMLLIKEEQARFDAEKIEVVLPNKRITQNDLPKERQGEDGWKNGSQLGAIIADLGILFEMPKGED